MIKINLATRKMSVSSGTQLNDSSSLTGKITYEATRMGLDSLRELPIKRIAMLAMAALAAGYVLDVTKQDELQKMDQAITKSTSENIKLKAELEKTKGFEEQKKALDADEKTLRTKIETVQKLIADRQLPPKMLQSISNAIQGLDVWLSDLRFTDEGVMFKGTASGFNAISDFIKGMSESVYFTDVKLVSTNQSKDEMGQEAAVFEVSARRR